jgi:hypothetical protein
VSGIDPAATALLIIAGAGIIARWLDRRRPPPPTSYAPTNTHPVVDRPWSDAGPGEERHE